MATKSIGKPKLITDPDGRVRIATAPPRVSVAKRIGAEAKAKRAVQAIEKAAPGRVRVTKRIP